MLNSLKFICIAMIGFWLLSSCGSETPYLGPEPERPAIPQYPILAFQDSTDVITSDAFVLPGEIFHVRLQGTKGDSLLKELSIQANNIDLDPSRVTVNNNPVTSSTIPILLDDRNGFVWDLAITAQSDSSKVIYEFKLEDKTRRTDFLDLLINTRITAFAPPTIDVLGQSKDEVLAGESVVFDFSMDAIGSPIKSLTVYQGAEIVSSDRLKFGGEPFASNPLELSAIDREGFVKSIEIATDSTFGGRQGFSVEFLDSLDNKFYEEVSLNTIRRVVSYTVTLGWNEALDLTRGNLIPIELAKVVDEDEKSDIRDISKTVGGWDKTLVATNQSSLKNIDASQGLVFDDIEGEKEIRISWPSAPDLTDQILIIDTILQTSIATGQDTSVVVENLFPLSDPLRVDDLLIARNENFYFLIKVKEVIAMDRKYVLDIKY